MTKTIRTYSELITLPDFRERFDYCKIEGKVIGEDTFGSWRWLNQYFYTTPEYRRIRREIILRDKGNDLACEGNPIYGMIVIHHLNPITKEDILDRSEYAWDPEYMVSTANLTHKAIHFGNFDLIDNTFTERRPNDTCPWRK